ncbi:unnamed protein product [Amoebophrya sp. A120]|nr:unnamed protein product [Amoebophrya sp. A120]|eukprot:GSA120T00020724001.1
MSPSPSNKREDAASSVNLTKVTSKLQVEGEKTSSIEVHSLPFHIEYDGPAPVSAYFIQEKDKEVGSCTSAAPATGAASDGKSSKNPKKIASFRGRELKGEEFSFSGGAANTKNDKASSPGAQVQELPGSSTNNTSAAAFVMRKMKNEDTEELEWRLSDRVSDITVWNAGREISEADEFPQLMQWMNIIAPALHT